ncbi:MAG TPA: hypothetical protein VFF33_00330 [Ignavibacteriaceae bacterium]|nr:hypothetical protein [Ignavibacteriaceae bacterium]
MFNVEKFNLAFSYSPWYFFILFAAVIGYAYYIYKYTIPQINLPKKILLMTLRIAALVILLFIIFEPVISLSTKKVMQPVTQFYFDNSKSMTINDGTGKEENLKNIFDDVNNNLNEFNGEAKTFGLNVKQISNDSSLNLSEANTNFSKIFSNIDANKNISSIVIISDGVITSGSNPVYAAEKLNVPVYTIGLGDTTQRNDIEVKNILFNEYIYIESPTVISATITNKGFVGQQIKITLSENNIVIGNQDITLTEEGSSQVNFDYTPRSPGEKKIVVSATVMNGEFNKENNKKIVYANVLDNKVNVLILAGSPSADLSFFRNTLEQDKNLSIKTITQITASKFLENDDRNKLIEQADIFYLIGFPGKNTPDDLINKVSNKISNKNTPFFINLTENTDYNKLNLLKNELPFSFKKQGEGFTEVQPNLITGKTDNPLIKGNTINEWNNLPPVLQPQLEIKAKPESEVLATIKINNNVIDNPLIITRRLGSKRSLAITAKDLWKWKLETATKNLQLFDLFINNNIQWLNSSEEKKQVRIRTTKKTYALGEPVEFNAQVYDESFNPVSDAEVKIKIKNKNSINDLTLTPLENGLYEGTLASEEPGDYTFTGEAVRNNTKLGGDAGSFNVGEVDIEMVNTSMDKEMLSTLASSTGGEFIYYKNYKKIFELLKSRLEKSKVEKIEKKEIDLWSNEWLMGVMIILLAAEWFFRKRTGML